MKIRKFKQANSTLAGGSAEEFGANEDVLDLPVFKDGEQIISCWKPTIRERISVLIFRRVWLFVHTPRTHSPVLLWAKRSVFEKEKK